MNRLWEENKTLIIVIGVFLLLLVIVRPTVFSIGPPLARWLGRDWKDRHDQLEQKKKKLETDLKEFEPGPDAELITEIQAKLRESNTRLRENYDQYVCSLAFVPPSPFRPPQTREDTEWGHHFRGILNETREKLLQYCSFRGVDLAKDIGFADVERDGAVPKGKDVPDLLRQLAVTDAFVRLCADSQIKSTQIVRHLPRREIVQKGRKFVWEYPMEVKLTAGFPNLMRLLDGLNGKHGRVRDVQINDLREVVEKVTLNIGQTSGVRKDDQFVLFRKSPSRPCALIYTGRVTVTSVLELECIARVDENSLPFDRIDLARKEGCMIEQGDWASTGFFRVNFMDLKATTGSVEAIDADGIPTRVIPYMVEATLMVSTLGFDPEAEYITEENVTKVTGLKIESTQPATDVRKVTHGAGRGW